MMRCVCGHDELQHREPVALQRVYRARTCDAGGCDCVAFEPRQGLEARRRRPYARPAVEHTAKYIDGRELFNRSR
jgi:hypothetical protein